MSEVEHDEGRLKDPSVHDAWFRAKAREALADPRPAIAHADVEAHVAKRRAAALEAERFIQTPISRIPRNNLSN